MSDRKSDAGDARDRKRVVRDDDQFFKRNPQRQYRVRRAAPVEVRQKQNNGGLPPLPQGWRWFLALRNIAEGRRVALFAPHLDDADTDVDEGTARDVFNHVAAARRPCHAPLTPETTGSTARSTASPITPVVLPAPRRTLTRYATCPCGFSKRRPALNVKSSGGWMPARPPG